MKKLFLLAAVAVFGMAQVNAQETRFGVKAGVDFASNKVKFAESSDFIGGSTTYSETGFYAGVFAEVGISEKFAFQPEVLFVAINELNQISVPLMAKFMVSDQFNILAGPALGILLDTGEGINSFNYGIEAGAAYDITEEFFVEARYNIGIANLFKDAPSGYSNRLSGFFVGAGYRF
ncbi:porin family protein [Gelidibacter pelagius]|uniref:PorT family protein n=1 Tax=Gelidibacter pelagius TaxID=2819985 RepID=A0ABS3SPS8_9FLAO|nr:porin family protein [Gelidibacter pelagius]MBO3097706.1 PorT family protein [Gelidibacter pelagius]